MSIFGHEDDDRRQCDHHHELHEINEKLEQILNVVKFTAKSEAFSMATLDQILADVTDESTKIDGLSTLTAGLAQQLKDALAGTTLPPAVQAKVDAVFAGVEANKGKVQAALDANVTPAPAPTPAPTPAA